MKKLLTLMLILLMAFAYGCILGGDDDDDKDDNGGSSVNAEEYLPLKVGKTWTWNITNSDGDSYTSTEEVTGTTTIDGKTYWVIEEESETGYEEESETTYIRIANNIGYIYMENEQFSEELHMFDLNKSPGKTWAIYSGSGETEEYSYSTTITGKYLGLKDVTVPAGSFKDCATSEFTVVSVISQTLRDEIFIGNYTEVHTFYSAYGIGPVKDGFVRTGESNEGTTEYWETRELKSYYIP